MALGRVALVKSTLGIDSTVVKYDTLISDRLLASTERFNGDIGYDLELTEHDESRTTKPGSQFLWLWNTPIVSINSVSFGTTAVSLTDFTIVNDNAIYRASGFPGGAYNTHVNYYAGIDTSGWNSVSLGNTSFMSGYRDVERVVVADAVMKILSDEPSNIATTSVNLGKGFLGIKKLQIGNTASLNSESIEYASLTSFKSVLKTEWESVVRRYKRKMVI